MKMSSANPMKVKLTLTRGLMLESEMGDVNHCVIANALKQKGFEDVSVSSGDAGDITCTKDGVEYANRRSAAADAVISAFDKNKETARPRELTLTLVPQKSED
jgi:hypothetical protein